MESHEQAKIERQPSPGRCVDHLANERTFLAWIRTSLGIMAFGFVVEKFALFLKQISYFLEKEELPKRFAEHAHSPSVFGVLLVLLGTVIGLFSYFRYKQIEKEIASDSFQSATAMAPVLTLGIVLIGIFLASYLL